MTSHETENQRLRAKIIHLQERNTTNVIGYQKDLMKMVSQLKDADGRVHFYGLQLLELRSTIADFNISSDGRLN